ncbi:Sphingolipid delta(4)-desaturase DES1 [Eumeta japonica]|uniref:Sphingolipid delta(4)-desaturase DES1 n=1 Tax=Eumeta variegata TaxID=151549 RepID=A0A4C1UEX0_EUMVA|nr:Sphingolipid delta(4)-desaturase DES1 [Eumeta japonica]
MHFTENFRPIKLLHRRAGQSLCLTSYNNNILDIEWYDNEDIDIEKIEEPQENHKESVIPYLGGDRIDPDLPTLIEARMFCTTGGKLLWLVLQPLFYSLRSLLVRPKPPTPLELVNLVIQLFFNAAVVKLYVKDVKLFIRIKYNTQLRRKREIGVAITKTNKTIIVGHYRTESHLFTMGLSGCAGGCALTGAGMGTGGLEPRLLITQISVKQITYT